MADRSALRRLLPLALASLFLPRHASAQTPKAHELEHVDTTFLALELGGSLVLAGTGLVASAQTVTECTWCKSNRFDEGVRDLLRAENPRPPGLFSHAVSSAAAPALALGALIPPALMQGQARHAIENVIIGGDTVLVTVGITQLAKRTFSRERPAVHHGVVGQTEYADNRNSWNQSFFSGDTSLAFALAASATTISYLRGYPSAPFVLVFGSVLAVSAGCLRIAGDVHWATDVITGAAVGTAVGVGLPLGLHARSSVAGAHSFVLVPRAGAGEVGVVASGAF